MKKVSLLLAALLVVGTSFAQHVTKSETKTKSTAHKMSTKADHKLHKAEKKVTKAM